MDEQLKKVSLFSSEEKYLKHYNEEKSRGCYISDYVIYKAVIQKEFVTSFFICLAIAIISYFMGVLSV